MRPIQDMDVDRARLTFRMATAPTHDGVWVGCDGTEGSERGQLCIRFKKDALNSQHGMKSKIMHTAYAGQCYS